MYMEKMVIFRSRSKFSYKMEIERELKMRGPRA